MAKKKTGKKNFNLGNIVNQVGDFVEDNGAGIGAIVGTVTGGPIGTAVGGIVGSVGSKVAKKSKGKGKQRIKQQIEQRSRAPRGKSPARSGTPSKVTEKAAAIDTANDETAELLELPSSPAVASAKQQAAGQGRQRGMQRALQAVGDIVESANEFAAEKIAGDVGPSMKAFAAKVDAQFDEVEGELDQVQTQTSQLAALHAGLKAELEAFIASNRVTDDAQAAAIAAASALLDSLRDLQLQDIAALDNLYSRLREAGLVPSGKGWMEDAKNGTIFVGPEHDQVALSIPTLVAAMAVCMGGTIVVADADYTPEVSLSLDMFRVEGSRILRCGPHIVRVEQASANPTNPRVLGAALTAPIAIKSSLVIHTYGNADVGGVQTLDGNVYPGPTSNDGNTLLPVTDGYIKPTRGVFLLERRYQLFSTLDIDRLLKLGASIASIGIAGPLWGTVLSLVVGPMIESYRTGKAAAMFATSRSAAADDAAHLTVGTVSSGTIES